MSQSPVIIARKRALREYALARRRVARDVAGPGAETRAANHYMATIPTPSGAIVSGYCAINEEIDVMPLLVRLIGAGLFCCLPVIPGKGKPLTFRLWSPGTPLVVGPFGISEPPETCAETEPTHLLVPLVAYDRDGHRLGYGGGYYDRSLRMLRKKRRVIAIGMAYTEQLVENLPHDEHDELLDWIVTERGAIPIPQ